MRAEDLERARAQRILGIARIERHAVFVPDGGGARSTTTRAIQLDGLIERHVYIVRSHRQRLVSYFENILNLNQIYNKRSNCKIRTRIEVTVPTISLHSTISSLRRACITACVGRLHDGAGSVT